MGRVSEVTSMLGEGRVGFSMDEVMTGEHRFEPGCGRDGKLFMEFRVRWGAKRLLPFLNPLGEEFCHNDLEGTVTVEGLCEDTPCKGTLVFHYHDEKLIRYTFDFEVDGRWYRYLGEKVNILPWNLPFSHTTCFGTLKESENGRLISRSVTYFRWRTTPSFLSSFRLR